MTGKPLGLCGMLLVLGAFCAGPALAAPRPTEEVTVASPYTIRQQVLTRGLSGQMQEMQFSVEKSVSYADLDLSKISDRTTLKHRIRHAAVESCRELERRFPRSIYTPVDSRNCVRSATDEALARLDQIGTKQSASLP